LVSGYELRDWVKTYPPAGPGNVPRSPGRWYERGRGSMYANSAGSVKVIKASEMLNRRWAEQHSFTPQMAEVKIGNSASYARRVHDETVQERVHKRHGWRTAQDAIRKFEPAIIKRISEAIDRAIGG